jgi:adenylate cyclase, class 2
LRAGLNKAVRVGRETEIKLCVEEPRKILALLKRIGAKTRGRVLEHNTLYDTPRAHFRRARCLLRVREESPAAGKGIAAGRSRSVLTWKAPLLGISSRYKQKLEQEVTARKRRNWRRAFKLLGLRPTFQYEKYRTSFHIGGLHLDFDETPVGNFLEIEGQPNAIDQIAKQLGFTIHDYRRETYWDIYAAHCKRLGRIPRNMLF